MGSSKPLFSGIRGVEVISSYLNRKHKKQAETLTGILLLLTMLHVCLWEGLASPLSKVHSPLATEKAASKVKMPQKSVLKTFGAF